MPDENKKEVINLANALKNKKLDIKFQNFFKGEEGNAWKRESVRLLSAYGPSDAILKKSYSEYIKITEAGDQVLKTSLKPGMDNLSQQANSSISIFSKTIRNYKRNIEEGFITAPDKRSSRNQVILNKTVDEARKHFNIIIKNLELYIKKIDINESTLDRNFIRSHNIITAINISVSSLKKIINSISFSYSSGEKNEVVEAKSIFENSIIQSVTCTGNKPREDSSMSFKFTKASFKRVDRYLRKNEITANSQNNISEKIKNDFSNFIKGNSNSGDRKEVLSSHMESLGNSSIQIEYQNQTEPILTISFPAPDEPGVYYRSSDFAIPGEYKISKSYKLKRVEDIIKTAIGEAPLYKCKHKGKWYFYTPAQLVLGGGKLTDSSGKKFRPKNGKPASLSRYGK